MKTFIFLSLLIGLLSCNKQPSQELPLLSGSAFKTEIDGKAVALYTLKSSNGLTMQVTNLGARVVTLWVPDKNGKYEDVVLGYETIDRYINNKGERF